MSFICSLPAQTPIVKQDRNICEQVNEQMEATLNTPKTKLLTYFVVISRQQSTVQRPNLSVRLNYCDVESSCLIRPNILSRKRKPPTTGCGSVVCIALNLFPFRSIIVCMVVAASTTVYFDIHRVFVEMKSEAVHFYRFICNDIKHQPVSTISSDVISRS